MQLLENVNLRKWHTLATPSRAAQLLLLDSPEECQLARMGDVVLGGGSNVFFAQQIAKRIVHPNWRGIKVLEETPEFVRVEAAAGELWNDFVACTVARGWYGLENLAAIPGQVGAAPIQNIGAYGAECKDALETVHFYHLPSQRFMSLAARECEFGYRQSIFKRALKGECIVTSLVFKLAKAGQLNLAYGPLAARRESLTTPQAVFAAVTAIRWSKLPHPEALPNAGSFFHNPIINADVFNHLQQCYPNAPFYPVDEQHYKVPAAWLIEQIGMKGQFVGHVGIYAKHALVVVNQGGTGEEILQFAQLINEKVQAKFGLITLQREPMLIGDGVDE